jgi:hypothetical protein
MFVHQIVCRYLHSNNLDGSIPPEIGNLVKLTYLYVLLLSRMQCSSNLCCSTGLWTSEHSFSTLLFEVSACVDHIWNNILHHIMFVHQIVCRGLSSNNLDGPIPPEIGNLTELTYLYVLLLSRMQCFHICVVPLDCGQVNTRFPPPYLKCLHVWIISGITFCITLCLSTKLSAGSSPPTNSMDQSLQRSGI